MPSYGVKRGRQRAQREQIAGAPPHLGRWPTQKRAETRQVMLDLVDGPCGIVGGGPRQPRLALFRRVALERLRVGDPPGQRPLHFHRVEGRHTRPCLRQLDSRVGQIHAPRRGADGYAQEEPLVLGAITLRPELSADLPPQGVQEDRVLSRLLGENALSKTGDEYYLEGVPPCLLERPHVHPPVAGRRRPLGHRG
jgi:hypothetical protein